ARASGQPTYQLDLWMGGAEHCRQLLYHAATQADVILIEGVMGLFDGTPCSADLATLLNVPVLTVVDATGTAQTVGAIVHGLASYRPGLPFAGVLANGVASTRHGEMVAQGMPAQIKFWGGLRRAAETVFPERHLGLMQADQIDRFDARLDAVVTQLAETDLAQLPPSVAFEAVISPALPPSLRDVRIGIARDAAFSFLYQANLDLLTALGAQLAFFSVLDDATLPAVDALYLPGGYPELHLDQLARNHGMRSALQAHARQNKPLYAECGGLLYLLDQLTDHAGRSAPMAAVLPGHAHMRDGLQGLGYQAVPLPGGALRGHTFHHSVVTTSMTPIGQGERLFNTSAGENIYQQGRTLASYLHAYFPSNPTAAAALFLP
ncbi:MAG: cobyrinate a,c-diamide synthase, partial [Pseudomonadota bacterium]|nr:cobyrinate a,c-diamide synthase [Pseudomonadota bacterium]